MSVPSTGWRDDARCAELAHPNGFQFFVSCFILLGILVSYLPQLWRIVARRSVEGLSPYFVLLGTTSGTCAIANIIMLPTSRSDVACCKVNSGFACVAGLLGIAQIGAQWSCFFLILFLFLIFTPRMQPDSTEVSRAAKQAIAIVAICVAHFFVTVLVCIVFLALHPHHLQGLANVLGIMAGVLAAIQYMPQIWTTWHLQEVGSLSVPMMCIQTPGGYIFAASLAARLGPEGWSTWAVYLVLATLQCILLIMAVAFEIRDRRARKNLNTTEHRINGQPDEAPVIAGTFANARPRQELDEDTPLLADNRSDRSRTGVL